VRRSRPGFDRALADLAAADTLVIWKLDRLGRQIFRGDRVHGRDKLAPSFAALAGFPDLFIGR
jgi:DNA invertase Pin-like site-specific DNA recombinase